MLQDLKDQTGAVVREGLTFDYPLSTRSSQIPSASTCATGSRPTGWPRNICCRTDEIEELYGVDVRGHCTEYSSDPNDPVSNMMKEWGGNGYHAGGKSSDSNEITALVWEIYNRKDGLVYTICDGYREFLREPEAPQIYNERFYPWYALIFNAVENEQRAVSAERRPADARHAARIQSLPRRAEGAAHRRPAVHRRGHRPDGRGETWRS